ncbi:hypothetical protein HPB50_005115 [Hyalomma asiaticum]|uniref:Uncharacterized protein n=1 Tax=Hyalomma asiaticum TaxID=266040 RepID=A0ACB7SZ36_HYAAI|nr:hypothetical protein HPB50_005115 [Hyalomma asiaticum]
MKKRYFAIHVESREVPSHQFKDYTPAALRVSSVRENRPMRDAGRTASRDVLDFRAQLGGLLLFIGRFVTYL